ncbi:MAG: hypothetical protein WC962_05690 [Phycisphaerae bacterium]|jgi:hypothetical protein
MKKKSFFPSLYVASILIILSAAAYCEESDSPQIQWAPTLEDVLDKEDFRILVFFEARSSCMADFEEAYETARFVEPEKIERIMDALAEFQFCENSEECAYANPAWMGIVDSNNQGVLIRMSWSHIDESVEWWGSKSSALYEVLYEYGVIQPPAKVIYVNDPNAVHFEKPKLESLPVKPKIISFIRSSDFDKMYVDVDPRRTPVYIQVDPNTPRIYVAAEPNSGEVYVNQLLPGINVMIEKNFELMLQNRWLRNNLNECLNRLEAKADLPPIEPEPFDLSYHMMLTGPNDLPYKMPQIRPLEPTGDIIRLTASMNLNALGLSSAVYSSRGTIGLFQQRIERLGISPQDDGP